MEEKKSDALEMAT